MIITRISFKNFKNFKEQTVDFGSGVNTIARQNRWGKTTIADGIAFAFVGKKYDGSSDVASFKTISDTKATATVELTVKLSSGRELTIRKDYYENWVKTRGTTDSILQGHLTDCYIDGIFKPVAEFNKEICALFGVKDLEMVQVLTNPYYFSQVMDWKKRREIVNLVIGEVIPEDVFSANPPTAFVTDDLRKAGFKISDARNILKNILSNSQGQGLKREEADLQAQISGATIAQPVSEEEYTNACIRVSSNENRITELRAKKIAMVNPVLQSLRSQLMEATANLNKSVSLDNDEIQKKNADILRKVEVERANQNALRKTQDETRSVLNRNTIKIDSDKRLIAEKTARLSELGKKYGERKAEVFQEPEASQCPQCGFVLNSAEIEEQRGKWNLTKAADLEKMKKEGFIIKAEIETLNKEIETLEAESETIRKAMEDDENAIIDLDTKIAELKAGIVYETKESQATKDIRRRVDELNRLIAEESSKPAATDEIDAQIEEIRKELEKANEIITVYRANKLILNQKLEREQRLAVVQTQIAEIEQKLIAIDEYTKTFLRLIGERVKSAFGNINIRLIENNIKAGSWNEVCYITDENGVPYESMNTEKKIKYGLKIIEVIASKLGYEIPPIVVDNCEAITSENRHFGIANQVICLVASDIDQTFAIQGDGIIQREEEKFA